MMYVEELPPYQLERVLGRSGLRQFTVEMQKVKKMRPLIISQKSYRMSIDPLSRKSPHLIELGKRQLIHQTQRQPRMLQHMIEAQILQLILGRMYLLIRVLEVGLDDKRRRIAGLGSAGVIGAGIAAFGEDVGDVAIL